VSADYETSVAHAERVLTRDAATFAAVRWRQTGFWRGYDANGSPATGRNLFGQVDGTANPSGDTMARAVWVDDDSWMAGGTTMMLRRFELNLNVWDTLTRERQEKVVGRNLTNGAPLTGVAERDVMDLAAKDADGQYVIAANAHSRLAHPDANSGRRMLRRGLNYVHDEDGRRTSGLMFIAFVRSIAGQLTPVLQRLDQTDALNEWTTPIGSSIWAFPGGYPQGSWLAQRLFDA
jgi:dye decolorizing peroxidase